MTAMFMNMNMRRATQTTTITKKFATTITITNAVTATITATNANYELKGF